MQKWAWEHSPEESLGAVLETVLGLFWTLMPCGRAASAVHAVAPHCLCWNPSSASSGRVTRNKALKPAKPHLFPLL